MDLLESVLKTANAEEYIEHFRTEGIDPKCIKILTDKDLEMIGVDNEDIRKKILAQTRNLIISSEKCVTISVDAEYVDLATLHIANQLKLHNANLFCAANRPDVINCNVNLHKATETLLSSIKNMKYELQAFKEKIKTTEKNKKISMKKKGVIMISLGFIALANVIIFRKLSLNKPMIQI